jgi:hypothetical protein
VESGLRPKACGDLVDAAATRDVRLADAVGAGATIEPLLERILTDHNIAFRDGVQGRDVKVGEIVRVFLGSTSLSPNLSKPISNTRHSLNTPKRQMDT